MIEKCLSDPASLLEHQEAWADRTQVSDRNQKEHACGRIRRRFQFQEACGLGSSLLAPRTVCSASLPDPGGSGSKVTHSHVLHL